jgi:hypothetical protein
MESSIGSPSRVRRDLQYGTEVGDDVKRGAEALPDRDGPERRRAGPSVGLGPRGEKGGGRSDLVRWAPGGKRLAGPKQSPGSFFKLEEFSRFKYDFLK